jgi:NitT/TauT family transport system permease protein
MDDIANAQSISPAVVNASERSAFSWRGFYRRRERLILGVAAAVVFLGVWELAPRLGLVKPLFTSSPSRIYLAGKWLFANGLWYDIWISFQEFAIGFGMAVVVGVGLGILIGWFPRPRAMLEPFVIVLYSVPRVALLPLIILWLGIGVYSKIAVVFLGAVFPIIMSVASGIRTEDETLVRCARVFGANDWQVLRSVAIPGAVPFMITGMRLGAGRGLVGVVVGELVASSAGVGHMMSVAGATFQTDKVFVGVILLAVFGLAISESLRFLEGRVDSWRPRR